MPEPLKDVKLNFSLVGIVLVAAGMWTLIIVLIRAYGK